MSSRVYISAPDDVSLSSAIHHWQQNFPAGGCLVLTAEKSHDDIEKLQQCFNQLNYPLIGAVFPQLIADGQFKAEGFLLIHMQHMPYHVLIEDLPIEDSALQECIDFHTDHLHPHLQGSRSNSLFMLFDSMCPNIGSVLERLYLKLSNQVHYFGVNAGSETFKPMTCLFNNDKLVGNALLLMLLNDHPGGNLAHCYQPPDKQVVVTSTDGNRIDSIDWQPAFTAYQQLIQEQYHVSITPENFYQYGVHFPFGIMRMDGEPLVRIPVALEQDGSLHCVGEVPANSLLTILKTVEKDDMDTVNTLVAAIRDTSTEHPLLGFYCAGRRMHLGEGADQELDALRDLLNTQRLDGALSLGEIGGSSAGGYPLFHNAAIVLAPWEQ